MRKAAYLSSISILLLPWVNLIFTRTISTPGKPIPLPEIFELASFSLFPIAITLFAAIIVVPTSILFDFLVLRRAWLGFTKNEWVPQEFSGFKFALNIFSFVLIFVGSFIYLMVSLLTMSSGVPAGALVLVTFGLGAKLLPWSVLLTEVSNLWSQRKTPNHSPKADS